MWAAQGFRLRAVDAFMPPGLWCDLTDALECVTPSSTAVCMQAIGAAQQAAADAEAAAEASTQALSSQLQEQTEESSKLREQLKKLSADLLDLRGQLDVQTTQHSMVEAREAQHQQQVQEQAVRLKEKAAELEAANKELQVGWLLFG